MNAKRKTAAQAAHQGATAQDDTPRTTPQEAPGGPRSAPSDPGRPDAPGDQARAPRARIPGGAPRNYLPETRTYAEAQAQAAPDEFVWPYAGPVHGIQGFSKLAGWAQQEALGGEREPADIVGDSPGALLILITQAKQMALCEPVQNALIAEHAEYGKFYLRAVRLPDQGFLIGIIDEKGATYCACEYYDSPEDLKEAWNEWAATVNK